jgi:hypothetical protein
LVERGKWLIIGLSAGTGIGVYEILKQIFKWKYKIYLIGGRPTATN